MADAPNQLGSVEVEVRANLTQFQKGLADAKREAQNFEARTQKLFGGPSVEVNKLRKEFDMVTRSTRLFSDEASRAATRINKLAEERRKLGQAFQQRINANLGIGTAPDSKARAEDIRVYSAALDDLRAKHVPLFAVQKQYQASVNDINNAHRLGAITADEHAEALMRSRLAYERAAQSSGLLAKSTRINSLQLGNLGAQFNDIAVTMAMGMNPWMIALQQGTQMTQVYGQMGAAKAVDMLKKSFMSLMNPVSLATIAIIGFGGMALQWLGKIGGEVKTLDQVLKQHEKNIDRLGPAYDKVLDRVKNYTTESAEVVNTLLRIDVDDMAEVLKDDIFKAMQKAKESASSSTILGLIRLTGVGQDSDFGQGILSTLTKLKAEFEPFKEIIALLEAGRINVIQFREEVNRMGDADPQFDKARDDLLKYTNDVFASYEALNGMTKEVDKVGLAFENMNLQLEKINPFGVEGRLADVEDAIGELIAKAQAGEISAEDLAKAITKIEDANPDLSIITNKITTLTEDIIKLKEEAKAAQTMLERFGYDIPAPKGGRVGRETLDEAQERFNFMRDFERRWGDLEDLEVDPTDKIEEAKKSADAYRDLIKNAQDRIDALKVEGQLLGQTGAAAAAYRFEQDLLADATDKGRVISTAQREEIAKLAEAYGELTEALTKAKFRQDLLFDSQQIFRNRIDQQIAAAQRAAGLEVDMNSTEGRMLRENILAKEVKDQLKDGISSFASDFESALLDNGGDIGEALAISIKNAMIKQLDKLIDEGIDALATVLTKALGYGGAASVPGASAGIDFGGVASAVGSFFSGKGSSSRTGYTAPVGQVTRAPLADIVTSSTMEMYQAAISKIESGSFTGNYSAIGQVVPKGMYAGQRALGRYQVMPGNIPQWSRQALGHEITSDQFLRNPGYQDAIFNDQFNRNIERYGTPQDAASVWFTGKPAARGARAADMHGTTGSSYVSQFNQGLEKLSGTTNEAANNIDKMATNSIKATDGLDGFDDKLTQASQALGQIGSGSGGGGGGLGGLLAGLFGGLGAGGGTGGGFGASTDFVYSYHGGGLAGLSGSRHRRVNPRMFIGAPRLHNGGFAPDEIPAILRRGEPVFKSMDHAKKIIGRTGNDNRPQDLNISVSVDGANGDQHVISLVHEGVSRGIAEYHQARENQYMNGGTR